MQTIEQFITWKETAHGQTYAWFDHKAAHEAGLVRRCIAMDSHPCYAAETIEVINGKFHLVEAEEDYETMEEAKTAAIKSAADYIAG